MVFGSGRMILRYVEGRPRFRAYRVSVQGFVVCRIQVACGCSQIGPNSSFQEFGHLALCRPDFFHHTGSLVDGGGEGSGCILSWRSLVWLKGVCRCVGFRVRFWHNGSEAHGVLQHVGKPCFCSCLAESQGGFMINSPEIKGLL